MKKNQEKNSIITSNNIANYNYTIVDKYECGIVLTGTEVKSLRKNNANIKDSYAIIDNNEIYLLNSFIAKYNEGNIFNHEERRNRKLLLHKNEIKKIFSKVNQKGYSLIPLKLYFKNNLVKVELSLAIGKKTHDKRESLKEKDNQSRLKKALKNY